ncbi:nuclease-related domain-containing protein [Cellulomonas massiliensis]|uniref:nuclease-related domain-containing protein n=1 Tax=Cellulomonas massiliensis TaxID=1465811 RepID=UPI000474BC26|nr:nuclease-related domain-containing protein [Cellulomonas massiliensis]
MDHLLTVRRWQRYGADRLFVTQETGAPIGSVDLQSGEVVVADPSLEDRLRRAAQAWLRADVPELVLEVPQQATLGPLDDEERAALEAWLGPQGDETAPAGVRVRAPLRARLDGLEADGWQVVHDVPLGRQGTTVDHLLIGPGGLFTVRERSHQGRVVHVEGRSMLVDGEPVAWLRDARLEAERIQGLLTSMGVSGVRVRPVLVVGGQIEYPEGCTDRPVVGPAAVPALFRAMPARLDGPRVTSLAKLARRRTTWTR